MTLYDYLGLAPTCTRQEVQAAFEARRDALVRARQATPSPAHRAQVEVEWRAIHAARDILGHPSRRAAYDRQLHRDDSTPPPAHPHGLPWRALVLLTLATLGLAAPWQERWLLLLWLSSLLAATGFWLAPVDARLRPPRSKS